MSDHPYSPPPLPPKSERKLARWALGGAIVGVVMCILFFLLPASFSDAAPSGPGNTLIPINLLMLFGTPSVAAILAAIPRTRAFGLGLLLAIGVCWLTELAICGGAAVISR